MSTSQPLVSVIVSVYNGERFLEATLRSLFDQDYPHFEAIVVDDGSTDRSSEILDRAAEARLKVIVKRNGGSASATAAGLAVATGEYVAFLDQDDLWTPDKLRRHVDRMRDCPEVDLTFSWFTVINDHGQGIGIRSRRVTGAVSFASLVTDFVIGGTSNVVARRDAILRAGGPDPAVPGMYDLDLFARIALLAPGNVVAIPLELMCYRRHANQATRGVAALQMEWSHTLAKLRQIAPAEVAAVAGAANSNMNRYFARLSYEGGQFAKGLGFLLRGFRLNPFGFTGDARNWLTVAACLAGCVLPAPLLRASERAAGLRRC